MTRPNAAGDMTNAQRALWSFLFYTLVGPFTGALLVVALQPPAALAGLLPRVAELDPAGLASFMGWTAMFTYVWAAPAAALAALGLLPLVFRSGTFGWIAAAVAGVLAFAVAAVVFTLPASGLMPYLAFLSGLVSVICRTVLVRIGVLAAL